MCPNSYIMWQNVMQCQTDKKYFTNREHLTLVWKLYPPWIIPKTKQRKNIKCEKVKCAIVGGPTSATNRNGWGGICSIYDFGERRKWFDLCQDRILNKQTHWNTHLRWNNHNFAKLVMKWGRFRNGSEIEVVHLRNLLSSDISAAQTAE